jgi:hypothetical protein
MTTDVLLQTMPLKKDRPVLNYEMELVSPSCLSSKKNVQINKPFMKCISICMPSVYCCSRKLTAKVREGFARVTTVSLRLMSAIFTSERERKK